MATLDDLKKTFFDECDEAMQQIEIGLTDIRSGEGNDETINAVFRGVHSVKGGAGIFGFEQLVEFAHVFETVLDGLRNGSLTATPENLDVLLSASDVLSDLVQMSRAGETIADGFGAEVRSGLEQIIEQGGGGGGANGDIAPAEFEGLDFMPVAVNLDDLDADVPLAGGEDSRSVYRIVFRPKPEMLKKANEPLYVLRELRKLGEAEIEANSDDLPALSEIEVDVPYLWWTITLRTEEKRAKVDEVFEFVMGDCQLSIEEEAPPPANVAPATVAADPAMPEAIAALPVIEAPSVAPAMPAPKAEIKPMASKPEGETSGGAGRGKPAATTTRIELDRIDRVVNMVGELVISQAMLGQIVQDLPESTSMRLIQILDEVAHHTRELKDSVMSMRAQPVGSVFQRMPRLVREVAAKTHKKVRLEMHGETTEVDRSIIERLGDPLTHIIRNSVDHGVEAPSARIAAGKPEEGVIRLAAEHRGGRIVIEIKDDGAGVNSERVLMIAREKGLVGPDAQLTEDEINNLIMMPGFSTAETISDISGRGVGMDVVRSNIQDLGGRITLKSVRGQGMTIQLALPLTLAVMDGMVIKVGTQTYVMPLSAIVECLRPSRGEINALIGTHGMLQLRGEFVPIILLSDLLGVDSAPGSNSERVVIVTDNGDGSRIGLVVDELLGHQQVVIKSIEESYGAVPGIAAATILGNGRVAFILDVEKLAELAAQTPITNHATSRAAQPALN